MNRKFHLLSGVPALAFGVALTACGEADFSSHQPPPAGTGGRASTGAGGTSPPNGGSNNGGPGGSTTGLGGSTGTGGAPTGLGGAPTGMGGATGAGGDMEPPADEEPPCAASPYWLPFTPPVRMFRPPPHPETECDFYRGAVHNFLIATQPHPDTGEPMIKHLPTIDDIFEHSRPLPAGALAPPGEPRGTSARSWLGDIRQAGQREILIDQNGHTLYYGLHVNQAYVDFLQEHGLTNGRAIQNADPYLAFPAGVAEFKTAWQEVDEENPPDDLDTYITTRAWVPTIVQGPAPNYIISEDRNRPREVLVRLLAIHSVFTFPGHPEFIWGSLEHSDGTPDTKAADGHRNVAPIHPGPADHPDDPVNPPPEDRLQLMDRTVISTDPHVLYREGTTAQQGNRAFLDNQLRLVTDPVTGSQRFNLANGQPAQTSIYRMFPASKSNTVDPDDAISTLNAAFERLWNEYSAQEGLLHENDRRGFYRLLGAQWMDKPAFFGLNKPLQNDETNPLLAAPAPGINQEDDRAAIRAMGIRPLDDLLANGGDGPFSILAGEDRMSSTAMESFTQYEGSFPNCFSCHNTQAITAKGVPLNRDSGGAVRLITPKLLNVSHILSQFILEDCDTPANRQPVTLDDGSMITAVVCPAMPAAQ